MAPAPNKLDEAELLLNELESVEQKLTQLQEGLTRSHRLATLGTIASIIAHEFNNVLTPVVSYCQLAQQNPEDLPLLRKAVDKALIGAQRAADISSSMLGFARNGTSENTCIVKPVIDEVFSCLGRPPERDGIQPKIDIQTDLAAAISPLGLQQVILNLVLNARQAMRRRGGELRITATGNDESVRITVADTGTGIPPEILPRVFEPFVTQRQSTTSGSEQGTGLGLAVCRDLIRAASGQITIQQTGPAGTTFAIELPAVQHDNDTESPAESPHESIRN